MGSKSKGFSAVEGPRPGSSGSSRSRDRENHDRFFHSISPDGGQERGAAGTRRSQRWPDSEPRHAVVPGQREGLPLHSSSACRPRHVLFAHASKRALARHVLLFCSLLHLGYAVGTECCSGCCGKGQRCRAQLPPVPLLHFCGAGQCGRGTAWDMGVQPGT